ncbi:DegT/DnrJ/EryC1/StrS family aminotransferase [Natronococcus wangiae]|uniref:DegT/DnrJ/EryC1/StrS family aminotransferase n=1 Tax=Natronococcus wangiae TaxID=3068275 RepID=UPI00273D0D65|nr:DegT/DnrJ/EryC1/StrS family aminotransferase [Natronococcus sp. AD5]
MIETLSLLLCVLAGRSTGLESSGPTGIEAFVEQHARDVTYYGSGKAALRDGLASIAEPGQNVLVPAYLPDAVVEPFCELGLEPRRYRIKETLAPDLADVERRIDADTVAVMSVNYFGFPQPGLDELTALIDEHGCYHIDDNAHAPLSVVDGTLLGTRGDLGITSLRKLLPIPDGALLYCNSDGVRERFEPSSLSGVHERFDASDCQFVAKSLAVDVFSADDRVRRSVDALVTGRRNSLAAANPADRYEAGKRPMSKLSARVVDNSDPKAIRSARRENYRTWRRVLASRDDLEVRWESLPDGICPQVFPVRTRDPERFLAELEGVGMRGAHTWPRLAESVRTDPTYETSTALARETVVLPVQQCVDPSSIRAVGEKLRR